MRSLVVLIAFLATFCTVAGMKNEKYRGDQVIRITVESGKDVEWLHGIEGRMALDFWTEPSTVLPVDVMVPRGNVDDFKMALDKHQLVYRVIKTDLQDDVDKSYQDATMALTSSARVRRTALQDFNYTMYHRYDAIQQWISDIAAEYSFVSKFSLGTTYEGREIGALEITAPADSNASNPKPIVYFQGGIHAREWISPATVMYFTRKLLDLYSNGDADARRVLGMYDLHIVPCLNGDGYEFTWTDERLWRKSRQPNPEFGCSGTDLNRNFDVFWGLEGASPWPCSIVFRGFSPLDNKETTAVDDYFQKLKESNRVTKVFVDWHSYSQLILVPWSYSSSADLPPEAEKQCGVVSNIRASDVSDLLLSPTSSKV